MKNELTLNHGLLPAHTFTTRVYVQHTDWGGVVYHARYLCFAEQARCEFLRSLGVPQHTLSANEEGFIVVKDCYLSFMHPARLDDLLEVRTYLKQLGGASVTLLQEVVCNARLLTVLQVRLGWVKTQGQAARLPMPLVKALQTAANTVQSKWLKKI